MARHTLNGSILALVLAATLALPAHTAVTPLLYPNHCHPVDADDVVIDRYGGSTGSITFGPEKEGWKDESEIKCVSEAKYQEIRHQLGLH